MLPTGMSKSGSLLCVKAVHLTPWPAVATSPDLFIFSRHCARLSVTHLDLLNAGRSKIENVVQMEESNCNADGSFVMSCLLHSRTAALLMLHIILCGAANGSDDADRTSRTTPWCASE